MKSDCIPFKKTGYFSNLICDYLDEKETLKPFFNRFSSLDNFKDQLLEKQANFPIENRTVLNGAMKRQYANIDISRSTELHIELLKDKSTFTVVTGHQLNLFTGPLYFLYKIISTINLTQQLKEVYPNYNFVPVYWMATEDHDFDEINYFNFKGKKLQWNKIASGAVGHLNTDGLDDIYDMFSLEIGMGQNAEELKALFKKAYLEHSNLTDATRYLANELFGEYGLVIVDGDDRELKKLLVPYAKMDILENSGYKAVSETSQKLEQLPENYGIQVNPREINYFYLKDGVRERIIEENGLFYINDTDLRFTEEEVLKELENYPERFSPNVISRPLYQEIILPNLCYIGGGGELASYF
jgi:bacillithiol biosynthesis cysteine-adding enzyme BshC